MFADEGMDIDELTKEIEKGNTLLRQHIKELQQKGVPILTAKNRKKLLYSIDLEQFELLGNEIS